MNLFKLEMYKAIKNNQIIIISIVYIIFEFFIFISCKNYISESYSFNNKIYQQLTSGHLFIFPILFGIYGSSILSKEYEKSNIKLLKTSSYGIEKIYIFKFISAIFLLCVIFVTVQFLFSFILLEITQCINFYYIKKIIIIMIISLVYLICFAAFTYLITTIVKKQSSTIIISMVTFFIYNFLEKYIPNEVRRCVFFYGKNSPALLKPTHIEVNWYLYIIMTLITTNIFLYLGTKIISKQEIL